LASELPEPQEDKKKTGADVEFEARIIAGFQYDSERPIGEEADTDLDFALRQARFKTRLRLKKTAYIKLSIEFADAFGIGAGQLPYLRDAELRYRPLKPLYVSLGHFKRPFSRLELKGSGSLPVLNRGLGNEYIVEFNRAPSAAVPNDMGGVSIVQGRQSLSYGSRGMGVMVEGRLLDPKVNGTDLRLFGSITTGPDVYANAQVSNGFDLHGRFEWDLNDWLSVGGGVAHKLREPGEDNASAGTAFNGDVRLKSDGLYLLVDAMLAEVLDVPGRPYAATVGGYLTYDLPLAKHLLLQPTAFAEWADLDLRYSESEALRFVLGVNQLWREMAYRLMPQVEFVRPTGTGPQAQWDERERYYLLISGELQ